MSVSRRSTVNHFLRAGRIVLAGLAFGGLAAIQGCSTSGNDASWKLWGNDSSASHKQATAQQPRSTTGFDADGPPVAGSYRGGRDPASGRAQEWPPAAPPSASNTAMAPLPPTAPAYQPSHPPAAPSYPPTPTPAYAPAATPAAGVATTIDVRQGDTLYRLARAYNVTVPAIMQANGLTSEGLKVGQRLNIPAR